MRTCPLMAIWPPNVVTHLAVGVTTNGTSRAVARCDRIRAEVACDKAGGYRSTRAIALARDSRA